MSSVIDLWTHVYNSVERTTSQTIFLTVGHSFKNVKNISQKVSVENMVAVEIATDHEKSPQWRAGFCTLFLVCGVLVPFAVTWGLSQPVCMKPVGSVCGLQVQPFTSRNSYMKSIKHLHIHPYSSTASWLMPYQWMLQLGPWTFKWILK